MPLQKVERLLKDDPEVLSLWHKTLTPQHGGVRVKGESKQDNILLEKHYGDSLPHRLARLKDKRPDLFKLVVAKNLSAHAAAIEAGWRYLVMAVLADDVDA